jgi:hypothetical protein
MLFTSAVDVSLENAPFQSHIGRKGFERGQRTFKCREGKEPRERRN